GAGVVSIWDHGTYEAEKWREGAEVIAVLTGARDGGLANAGLGRRVRFVLIRTGGPRDQWLIRLMKSQPDDELPNNEGIDEKVRAKADDGEGPGHEERPAEAQLDGEARPDDEAQPDNEAQLDNEAQPDDEAHLDGEARPDEEVRGPDD